MILLNLTCSFSLLTLSKYFTRSLGAQSWISTTEASFIVMSQSSCKSNTNYQIGIVMKAEFFLKNSKFLEILTLLKSYESPQNDPKMLSPPALDSDSLEERSDSSMGSTTCLSFWWNIDWV